MVKLLSTRVKTLAVLWIVLAFMGAVLSLVPGVRSDVSILSVTPSSGYVGDSINVVANTTIDNSPYTILFDGNQVTNGNALGKLINGSFSVPYSVFGPHSITVQDQAGAANTTFNVLTRFSLGTDAPQLPKQFQENANVSISMNVTGGQSGLPYTANLNVKAPTNGTYSVNVTLAAMTEPGHYVGATAYPSAAWTPSTPNITYVGTYAVSWVNGTQVLDSTNFTIGITNATQYHRRDFVDIKAVDYPVDQNFTITISGLGVSYSKNFNASSDSQGVIQANWTIPDDMAVGKYNMSITPIPSSKSILGDAQVFEVPGFGVDIITFNLAGKRISGIFVMTRDNSTGTYYNATSNINGTANVMLEIGNYRAQTFFEAVKVGQNDNISISGPTQVNITCQLTSMIVEVTDVQNVAVPFVSVDVNYNYTTNLDVQQNKNGSAFAQTNITGIAEFDSLFPDNTYHVNASRYGVVFKQENYTLPAVPYSIIPVQVPAEKLQADVVDASGMPIAGVSVAAQEVLGGMRYENTTDSGGSVELRCTLGRYSVKASQGTILLNETTVDLFGDTKTTIVCTLFGLNVSVTITDYFGQPIANTVVAWQGNGLTTNRTADSSGTVAFDNVIGGNVQITVTLPGHSQPDTVRLCYIQNSTSIPIKIEKYIILAGFLVETGQLATVTIIVLAIIVIVSVEVYRRRRAVQKQEPEQEQQ